MYRRILMICTSREEKTTRESARLLKYFEFPGVGPFRDLKRWRKERNRCSHKRCKKGERDSRSDERRKRKSNIIKK